MPSSRNICEPANYSSRPVDERQTITANNSRADDIERVGFSSYPHIDFKGENNFLLAEQPEQNPIFPVIVGNQKWRFIAINGGAGEPPFRGFTSVTQRNPPYFRRLWD
ncbi:hypothetical protein KM043_013127 [Ampulex compressa]|nr:hypothetical protein KM043_013127 [Ampulex compressa]